MAKPVLVLADSDEQYLPLLEQSFWQEYQDSVEIYKITDPRYFQWYFREPHRVDVMIAGEGFYHPGLLQWKFPCVLALANRPEQAGMDASGVLHVNKYGASEAVNASIRAYILQLTQPTLQAAAKQSEWTQLIAVYSAAGGCGKTTVALGLASALAAAGKRVLYVDAERLNHFQDLLPGAEPLPAVECRKLTKPDSYLKLRGQLRRAGFTYLPPLPRNLMPLNLDFSVFSGFLDSARRSGDFNAILVDTDSVFDNYKGYLLSISDQILLLTDWSAASLRATERIYDNMDPWMREKVIGIANNSRAAERLALPADTLNFPLQEQIPYLNRLSQTTPAEWAQSAEIRRLPWLLTSRLWPDERQPQQMPL